MMNNHVQNFGAATGPLFKEIDKALLARPIDVNGLLQKMDMLRKMHLLLTVNAATLREQYNSKDNKEYVNKTVQVISNILFQTDPAFTSENSLQHLRNMVLDHIYFIGTHHLAVLDEEAVLRSFFNAFVRLYEMDNEENCLLGFKIILKIFERIDLTVANHLGFIIVNQLEKFYRKIMECYKDINLKMCLKTHVNGPCTMKTLLENLHSPIFVIGPNKQMVRVLPRASKSLQVLAEAPQVLNHILELWYIGYGGGLIDKSWKAIVETFLKIINLKCDEKLRKNSNFCKDTYLVFLKLQISSLEFLLHLQLLRKEITNHKDLKRLICGFLSLLKSCPTNAINLRRKLVKVLHVILSLKIVVGEEIEVARRDYLIQYVPQVLLDDLRCYNGPAIYDDVRASYFNVLLGFLGGVHHMLTKEEIGLIIKSFLPVVYDSSLPVEIHNAICLLLVEFEKRRQESVDFFPAQILLEMLQAFNMRLKVFVKSDLPFIRKKLKESETFFDCEDYCCTDFSYYRHLRDPSSNFISDFKKATNKKSIDESKNSFTIQRCKDLIENIFQGAYGVAKQCGGRRQQGDLNYIQPFSDFLKYSVQAMGLYCIPSKSCISPDVTLKKHHELLRLAAEIFMLLPPTDFPKIFSANVNILLDELRQDPLLRVFLQILLLNSSSGELIAVFLDFVLKQLEDFDDKEKSPALFFVLHDVVVSLMKFDAKEEILEIYLLPMIEKCMELTLTAKEPCNFLKVIHLLFLAVKADDTETDIGRSLLSSLPTFIQILHFWYKTSTNPDFSNLALQVSITILSSCDSRLLIPNLSLVLMLVVITLNKNVPELTINALKILQSFEYLDKSLVNIKMSFSKLELANGLQHTLSSGMDGVVECAFRLLNKYYGSQHISSQFKYEALTFTPAMNISFKNGYTVSLPLDKLIKSTFLIAHPKPAICLLLKEHLKIMKYYLSSVFNEDCSDLINHVLSSNLSLNLSNQRLTQKSISYFDAMKPLDSPRFVLMGILAVASYNCDIDEISMFFEQCMMHCTVHCLHGAISPLSKENGIDGFIIVDAISSFLSFCSGSDIELVACIEKSLKALEIFVEISETVVGIKIWEFSLFEQIWKKVCLLCYEKEWHTQTFACKAMQLFINKCPTDWKCNHLAEFIMHLLYVMKISSLENLLERNVCTLAGTILQDTFSVIKENLKDILNPVLEISVTCMFSTCETVRKQGNRLFKFLKEISSEQIELMLPDLSQIKLMLNDLSRIDKCLESVPLKSKVGILDGFLFFLDVWPKLLEIIGPRGVQYLINSCNFVLDDCVAFSKISNDHTDFCKRAFKVLFFWSKESSAVELLNKVLQCDSYELFSTTFEYCFQLKNILPIRKWLKDSKRQLVDLPIVRKMKENAGEEEFPTIQDFYLLKHIRHMCCLLVLLKDNLQQEDQRVYLFILHIVLSRLRRSSDFSLELKWRRIFKDTFFVLDDVKDVFLDVVSSVFKFNPERIVEFFIVEFLSANNQERKLRISFFIDHLLQGKWGRHLHPVLLSNDPFIRDIRLSNILYPLEPEIFENKYIFLNWMLCGGDRSRTPRNGVYGNSINKIYSTPNELTYFAIEMIHCLHQYDDDLLKEASIVYALRKIWSLLEKQDELFPPKIYSFPRLKQHIKLAVLLMEIYKFSNETELLFELLKAPVDRFPVHFQFLTDFLKVEVIEKQSDLWKKEAFVKFVLIHASKSYSTNLEIKILENLIIPSFLFPMKKLDFYVFKYMTNKDINEEFQQAVLVCFEELTKSECEIKKPLLQLSCLLLECACYYISEDFLGELKAFTQLHIQQSDSGRNFYDPLIKSYWDLFSAYLLKIVKARFTPDVYSKILRNSLSFYTPDVREVSTCTLDILIPNMCSERGGSLFYVHWTSVILEDGSLSICRLHPGYKDEKKECFARRLRFEHIYHAVVNNSEECILHTGFMHLLLDVINGMENIDKLKYICETFEMILDYVLANKNNTKLTPMKCLSLRETASSIAKMLFKLPILKPENSKIDEMGCRKIVSICRKIHYLDSVGFLRLYPNHPETRLITNDILEYLRRLSVSYCFDFILYLQNVDGKMYFDMDVIDLLVFFSKTSKMANLLKSLSNLKQVRKSAWVKFFKATDEFLKVCFWQPENSVSLDEFPDFPFQDYAFLKEYVLDLKEVIKGFIDFFNKMVKNLVLLAADFSQSSKLKFREKMTLYINVKFIRCLLNLEKLMEADLDPKVGEDPSTSLEFICNSVYHTVGWGILKLTVTVFPECFNSFEFIELVKKVLWSNLEPIKVTSTFNTDEAKLIITLEIIEFGFLKIYDCGEVKNLLVRLAEVIKSGEIFITILNIIRKWFIKDLLQDNCTRDELLNLVKMVSNRIKLEFSKDYQVCIEHFKLMKLIYSYFESEYQYDPFSFDSVVVLHSGIPETRMEFIHMCNSLTLNDVMKHLPCVGLWSSTPFSLARCFELVTSTVLELPMESSSAYPYIEAQSTEKKLDIILKGIKSFKADLCKINSSSFFDAVLKLSEVDNNLLKDMWSNLFPELWNVLLEDSEGKKSVAEQYEEFVKNAISCRNDWKNNEIGIFVDVFFSCYSLPLFSRSFLQFVEAFPGLSKKIFLKLEDFILGNDLSEIPKSEIYLQLLSKAYFELKDDDLLSGFHQQYSKCPELCAGIVHQNLGDFYEALDEYKDAMKRKIVEQIENEFDQAEMDLLRSYRIKCVKQLGDWDNLKETNGDLETKEADELSKSCKYLQRVFQENTLPLSEISPALKALSYVCIEELKSLSPCLFTPNHIHLLQTGRIVLEFEKALRLQTFLQGDVADFEFLGAANIFQSWFNNMPSVKDDLSFWNDITIHRLNQLKLYQTYVVQNVPMEGFPMQKMKSVAQLAYNSCIKSLAKAMYAHGLPNVCVKLLQKCKALIVNEENMELYLESLLLEMKLSKNDRRKNEILQAKAYSFLESAEFPKSTTEAGEAMCNVYQGLILSKINEQNTNEEYEKTIEEKFFVSYQKLTDWSKGWLYCGNFFQERFNSGDERCCEYALRSFIMSCKYDNNTTSMEPLAKIIWLLSFPSDVPLNLRNNIIEDITQIPISYWLAWIPQLLAAFLRIKDCHLSYILHNISLKHPESLYFLLHSVMIEANCMSEGEGHLNYQSCVEIMDNMKVRHPVLISSLEKIENEFILVGEKINPNILFILRRIEIKICDLLFLCASKQIAADSIDKKVQDMFIESRSSLESESDPELKIVISDLLNTSERSLKNILCKLSECIRSYTKKKKGRRSFALDPRSFLLSFCTEQVEMFFNSFVKHQPCVFISRILPKIDVIERDGKSACRIFIEGTNGKVYPYAIMPNYSMTSFMQESRVFQFFSFLNDLLQMEQETSKRLLKFSVPSITPIHAKFKIVEDDVSSTSLLDIFEKEYDELVRVFNGFHHNVGKQSNASSWVSPSNIAVPDQVEWRDKGLVLPIKNQNCTKVEENDFMTPFLFLYYELYIMMLFSLDDIQIHVEKLFCTVQKYIVPRTILKQEFRNRTPSDYYELRKRFSRDISLYYFAQSCFCLNERIPEKFYIHQDDGKVTSFGSIFNYFDDVADPSFSQDVPFRITPNISTFITPIGILGYVQLAMCATARCFSRHNEKFESVLKAICLNETADCLFTVTSKSFDHQKICKFIDLVTEKVEGLADIRGFGGQIDHLIALSEDCTKSSMMFPSYYPWL